MTLAEKECKLKLILLIIIVENEKIRRCNKHKITEYILITCEIFFWLKEYYILESQLLPRFPKGGVAIIGDKNHHEPIIR